MIISYPTGAKKTLELHYTMIQFLIITFIPFCCLYPLDLDIKLNFNISKGASTEAETEASLSFKMAAGHHVFRSKSRVKLLEMSL